MPQMLEALDERDVMDRLTPELRGIGITDDMSAAERLKTLGKAMDSRDPRMRATARGAVSETARQGLPALLRAIESGEIESVQRDLATPDLEGMWEFALESDMFRIAQEQGANDQRKVTFERDVERSRRERIIRGLARVREERGQGPWRRAFEGFMDNWLPLTEDALASELAVQQQALRKERPELFEQGTSRHRFDPGPPNRLFDPTFDDTSEGGATTIYNNTTVIHTQFNNTSGPGTGDLEGPAFRP